MIDDFEEILWKMQEIHQHWPSLRFGQVIENAADAVKNLYNLTDDGLLIMLEKYLEENL